MTNEMLQRDDTKPVRLLVALELSLSKWGIAAAVEGQPRKRVKTVAGGDYAALREAVRETKERFNLPAEAPVVFCYEAGRDGFYPYWRLVELGHSVWVIDSASIEVSRHRRRAKSDGIDAEKLVELMQRKAGGEQRALRILRVPEREVEDQRQVPRERENFLTNRRRLLNQIESALFLQGYREVPKNGVALKKWLEQPREIGVQLQERLWCDVERLALVALPAGFRLEPTVPGALQRRRQAAEADRHRGPGTPSGGGVMAVYGARRYPRRRPVERDWPLRTGIFRITRPLTTDCDGPVGVPSCPLVSGP